MTAGPDPIPVRGTDPWPDQAEAAPGPEDHIDELYPISDAPHRPGTARLLQVWQRIPDWAQAATPAVVAAAAVWIVAPGAPLSRALVGAGVAVVTLAAGTVPASGRPSRGTGHASWLIAGAAVAALLAWMSWAVAVVTVTTVVAAVVGTRR